MPAVYRHDFSASLPPQWRTATIDGYLRHPNCPLKFCIDFSIEAPADPGHAVDDDPRIELLTGILERGAGLLEHVQTRLRGLVKAAHDAFLNDDQAFALDLGSERLPRHVDAKVMQIAELDARCRIELEQFKSKLLAFWKQAGRDALSTTRAHDVHLSYNRISAGVSMILSAVGLQVSGNLGTSIFSVIGSVIKITVAIYYYRRDLDQLADSLKGGLIAYGVQQGHRSSAEQQVHVAGSRSTTQIVAGDFALGIWNRLLGDSATAAGCYSTAALDRQCKEYKAKVDALLLALSDAQMARAQLGLRTSDESVAVSGLRVDTDVMIDASRKHLQAHVMRQINYQMKIRMMIDAHRLKTSPCGGKLLTASNAMTVIGIGSELVLPLTFPASNVGWYWTKFGMIMVREGIVIARMLGDVDAVVAAVLRLTPRTPLLDRANATVRSAALASGPVAVMGGSQWAIGLPFTH